MVIQRKKLQDTRQRRRRRVRAVVSGSKERPRLAVFRSLKHISAQIIDDTVGRTIASANDRELDKSLKGIKRAAAVGARLAEMAKRHGIKAIVFDRRHYKYHGQVKALAEAVREGGLKF
ncbi:50S ribosomal protein L18 [Candidatus Uhrbacteria bacterium RIFCSPLOWO2_02_FULL_48_12]|uniref:Large ribosomal subunit protein uL18 n=1 Tax=Candidatus Uhrbacteria bacterium RIFCSPLOWO2_02_FULL_48_12 TaxID=1802407 RepID=A0A1F7VAL3_9BACT|nr:MAG: 50S ribosomal protein L18 [Candidatus Uhrbacteria bacterium RIFCSPLOWO2_02_FULL_48_12]